jgi:hypothetical protein
MFTAEMWNRNDDVTYLTILSSVYTYTLECTFETTTTKDLPPVDRVRTKVPTTVVRMDKKKRKRNNNVFIDQSEKLLYLSILIIIFIYDARFDSPVSHFVHQFIPYILGAPQRGFKPSQAIASLFLPIPLPLS